MGFTTRSSGDSEDSDDDYYIGLGAKLKRRRTVHDHVSDGNMCDSVPPENDRNLTKEGQQNDEKDSGLDYQSSTAEAIRTSDTLRKKDSIGKFNWMSASPEKLRSNNDADDSCADDVLPVPVALKDDDEPDPKSQDFDSDETIFEPPSDSEHSPFRDDGNHPSQRKRVCFSPLLTTEKLKRNDDSIQAGESSDSDATDFETESLVSASPHRSSNYESAAAPIDHSILSDGDGSSNDSRQQQRPWYEVDGNLNSDTPPVYNPAAAGQQDWFRDVRRTVKMLDATIQEMPMPGDDDDGSVTLPPGLVQLYQHQKYALRWMSWREERYPGGGILADEMGLGKTIEVIALIMKSKCDEINARGDNVVPLQEAGSLVPSRTTLVVSPLSCIPQWIREIKTKGKNLRVYKFHGKMKMCSAVDLAKYDVVITTYQTIVSEIPKPPEPGEVPKRCFSPLKRIYWVRIVLDEAHQIRNPDTHSAQAIYQLEARHRWAVTGTPIHNKPEDFYSMCTFLRMEPFNDRAVWSYWIGLKYISDNTGAEQRLHILGKALILRRTKAEVGLSNDAGMQPIPSKTVEIVSIDLSKEEREVYDVLMEHARNVLSQFLSQKEKRKQESKSRSLAGDCAEKKTEKDPGLILFSHIFALLIRLRQCSVLPHLIETMLVDEEFEVEEDFNELKPEHIFSKKNPVFDKRYVSSKFQKILDDLGELYAKAAATGEPMEKVIIVSCWTSTLDLLYQHLLAKNFTCVFITGREDMNLRTQNMDRFNRNRWRPNILLLSLMAGGVGLNLVGANHVYFLEPHWNPQHELQAQDRVHRFGQTKAVFIRRYIAEDTLEGRILGLQQQKLELANGLLNNTKKKSGAGVSLQQIMDLFDMTNHRCGCSDAVQQMKESKNVDALEK